MKRILPFSRFFLPAGILSVILIGLSIFGLASRGFNLGVDFQGGLMQEIQFAHPALSLSYSGRGNASITLSRSSLTVVISGAGIDEIQYDFPFADTGYPEIQDLLSGLSEIEGLETYSEVPSSARSSWLIMSAQSESLLGAEPTVIHYLSPNEEIILIEDVRGSLIHLGTVSVQVLGDPSERRFMVRVDKSSDAEEDIPAEIIIAALEETFGDGGVAVTRSDYVDERVSGQLVNQIAFLLFITLLLILTYCAIRFKLQYAVGAVLGITHNALIMTGFIIWTGMEFNTTTIAAILTILGYSINDTVVVFDRIRETRRLFPDDPYVTMLNRALSDMMGRTIITTFTTMLAVASLYLFTTGSMKDFALALMVGMITGVYSTLFIASGIVNLWEHQKEKRKSSSALPKPVKA